MSAKKRVPDEDVIARNDDPWLLGVREVAHRLGLSRATVYEMYKSGRIPRPMRLGSKLLWEAEALRHWIKTGCRGLGKWNGR